MEETFPALSEGQDINGYVLIKKLCETKMSIVFRAERNGENFAAKFIKRRSEYSKHIETEVRLLQSINCPYVMGAQDFFDYEGYVCVVMKLADGSLAANKKHPEEVVRKLVLCGLKALKYLHDRHIWHRDVKVDNFLVCGDEFIIADLGLAVETNEEKISNEFVGTLRYAAPEVITHEPYDGSVDIWSLGVTAYTLIAGASPFPTSPESCMRRCISKAAFCFPSRVWGKVSKEARDLISNMIVADPKRRVTIEQAMLSPWFASEICHNSTTEYLS